VRGALAVVRQTRSSDVGECATNSFAFRQTGEPFRITGGKQLGGTPDRNGLELLFPEKEECNQFLIADD
jgi:hypothetical protein